MLETPQMAPEMVWFQTENYHELNPNELRLRWDKTNLTVDESAKVRISVWGYREDTVNPRMEYIDMLEVKIFEYVDVLISNSMCKKTLK